MMAELACKLRVDPTARQRFHQSFEMVVTRMDTPKSGIRSETGTE